MEQQTAGSFSGALIPCSGVEPLPRVTNIDDDAVRFSVYILMNPAHEIYIGYSANLSHRLQQHRMGKGARATKDRGPWYLVKVENYFSESDARQRELELIRNFNFALRQTYNSRKAILQKLGAEFFDYAATLL